MSQPTTQASLRKKYEAWEVATGDEQAKLAEEICLCVPILIGKIDSLQDDNRDLRLRLNKALGHATRDRGQP